MSSNPSLREFAKDLYRLLRLPRTATQIEIKRSYREMALTLHPDRHHVGGGGGGDEDHNSVTATSTQQQQQQQQQTTAERARQLTNERKTAQFKEVSEAYRILSDITLRREYDRWLDTVHITVDGNVVYTRGGVSSSRAAERNPFYRKVYSPAAPPGMKTFDRQRHYGKRARES